MLFFKKKQKVIITIHGFGKNVQHEFDPLAKHIDEKKYQIIQFDMYDPYDPHDDNYETWIKKAEEKIHEYKDQEIILLGFSMGGVIASYLASIYHVRSLILVAPAFQYLDLANITNHGIKIVKNLAKKSVSVPSASQTKAFQTIINQYKESIYHIDCPVTIFHGTKDEVIPVESSKNIYSNIPGKKRLIYIEGGKHRMLYDGIMEECIFTLIDDALEDKLI